MKYTMFTMLAIFGLTMASQAQQQSTDSLQGKKVTLNEVVVSASRVTDKIPVTFTNIKKEDIERVNLGQDIPVLLNYLPSVVATTFDGTGIGYTDFRIRGADNSRINVTINGIPYNDADSQTTFFVNLQDFASSIENIQVQRGVGTSTNGAGAFGASINILTDNYNEEAFGQISNSFGSFNSRKHSVRFGTGLLNNHFAFSGRLSRIKSDGYINRAFSDLSSYFLDGVYKDENTLIKALVFGGQEITGLAFFGLNAARLQEDRTFNDDGLYLDADGNVQFYDRQTDNYKQDHYQLHISQKFDANWSGNISFHYTFGRGFFEQYIDSDPTFFNPDLSFYGLPSFDSNGETIDRSDLVTERFLNSDFYGTVFNLNYNDTKWDVVIGGGINRYDGVQFGDITVAEFAPLPSIPFTFYENESDKRDFNIYTKATYQLNDKLSLFGDLQLRNIKYDASGELFGGGTLEVDENYTFFNPKTGITYQPNKKNKIYLSYARANREPARVDFENGNPESESLNDFELGWRYVSPKFQVNTNVYYLDFKNQLVLTGRLDEVGFPIRDNVDNSHRLGLEIDANIEIGKFIIRPNLALSSNKIKDLQIDNFNGSGETVIADTDISFSPSIIAGNVFTYNATKNFNASLFSKYVGEQFITNTNSNPIESYFVNDINLQYSLKDISILKSIVFTGQVNNIFDLEYENNGYEFFGESFFYPQAGINFLLGATLNF